MSVTVITTTGNTYSVPRGNWWHEMIMQTGELSVSVFAVDPNTLPEDALLTEELAGFGSVEVVYRDSEVTVVPAPAARSGL